MNLFEAMKMRAAAVKAKANMQAAGMDVSKCRYISDLAPILRQHLPAEMAAQAEALLGDKEQVTALVEAFTGCADAGILLDVIYTPTDEVGKDDVNA